ncbi:MAG: ATP-binding cassette domain-containing protein [Clostridia bacterium]|nr:ATP-binding cassette domain-containing protein [Clostridia bacterium]
MALLTLKEVGKIYVSEGNVAVGIRGVNLSFDRGEFVAVTGKSGSGKSTLLNVISGMDSYEEGELYLEGQPTSHYLQPEWEEYRQKYISFIFQDYNIIESFTVLQNVELALMHIEDVKQRKRRALELLARVGMSSHVKQKGSQLSGGQKQRTVIARALAKDSPIILADEPTGNLDSATSKEIIELLREVSKDKLLIVVTHNFEQVASYATRHVRIFDGAVESDHGIKPVSPVSEKEELGATNNKNNKNNARKINFKSVKNGFTLGRTIFTSKPKLSVFLCFLMIVGALGIFLITALCGGRIAAAFQPNYMFRPIDGRVVVTTRTGEVIGEEQVKQLASEYGAEDYVRYDVVFDGNSAFYTPYSYGLSYYPCEYAYGETYGDNIIGRYPTAANEVFLYLNIYYQEYFGENELTQKSITLNDMQFTVTGLKYFYDNNLNNKVIFTKEGFHVATAAYFFQNDISINVDVTDKKGEREDAHFNFSYGKLIPSFGVEEGKIYIENSDYQNQIKNDPDAAWQTTARISSTYYSYGNYGSTKDYNWGKTFTNEFFTDKAPSLEYNNNYYYRDCLVYISPSLLTQMMEEIFDSYYSQFSLLFQNDAAAHAAAERLQEAGYIAVPSDTTYELGEWTAIEAILQSLIMLAVWFLVILFLAFFLNLCSRRTLEAFKGDMAIMRSMGIPVKVIKIAMYVRMLFALIPAYLFVILAAIFIYVNPTFNALFTYLYAWQYALMFVGLLILTVRITHKQIHQLFGQSVKKSLKGGSAV